MEILAGVICGLSVFIVFYKDYIKKEKRIKELVNLLKLLSMDEKTEQRLWNKIDKIESDLTMLKIDVNSIKSKVFTITAIASFLASAIVALGSKLI